MNDRAIDKAKEIRQKCQEAVALTEKLMERVQRTALAKHLLKLKRLRSKQLARLEEVDNLLASLVHHVDWQNVLSRWVADKKREKTVEECHEPRDASGVFSTAEVEMFSEAIRKPTG